jgi:hypothetical protein
MKIKIEWLSDDYDCEQCGGAWASGAKVTFEDGSSFELTPVASCFGGEDYTADDVFIAILKHLGHDVEAT